MKGHTMFVCNKCKQPIGPLIQPVIVPTGMRKVIYKHRVYKHSKEDVIDSGGTGTERTGEQYLCSECAQFIVMKILDDDAKR